ncbi:DUF3526 domain-containing protein [Paraflavitalea sp. CAU 1676]|uniref:ABC transporter permease n=1 Tax=Paraflavitalea sp. CAU 1676 TaxID=3032598 RepID=UPI0023D9C543|nr:DUF3526 domain-containing protein [Paraflavitalea sp. CAU 1676]MDF2192039.1 DUF3526 domain-containing protein [Paraflavitalea sp. CAU 1676]
MRIPIIKLIAHHSWKRAFSNSGVFVLNLLIAMLLIYAAVTGWMTVDKQVAMRQQYQEQARHDWLSNPDKHPHRMAHYGHFAFRPRPSLSFFDFGMENFMGSTQFLEAHKQNAVNFSEAGFSTGLLRFGELSIAMILQVLVPLLICFLGFNSIATEREDGTLKVLFSQGVSWQELITGKAVGIIAVVLALYLPVLLLSIGFWLMLTGFAVSADELIRLLSIAGIYFLYFVIYSLIAVLISAWSKTARSALVQLIGIWLLFTTVLPRATQSVGSWLHPAPSATVFQAAVEKDVLKEGDSHNPDDRHYKAIKDSVLKANQVESVEQLRFNYSGFIMAEGEKISATIYNRHLEQLQHIYAQQNRLARYTAFVNPFLSVKNLSMAMTGTDYQSYASFQQQAEEYRYGLAQQMNALQMKYISNHKPGPGDKPAIIGREHWATLPEFSYRPVSLGAAVGHELLSLTALICWLLLLTVLVQVSSQKLKAI